MASSSSASSSAAPAAAPVADPVLGAEPSLVPADIAFITEEPVGDGDEMDHVANRDEMFDEAAPEQAAGGAGGAAGLPGGGWCVEDAAETAAFVAQLARLGMSGASNKNAAMLSPPGSWLFHGPSASLSGLARPVHPVDRAVTDLRILEGLLERKCGDGLCASAHTPPYLAAFEAILYAVVHSVSSVPDAFAEMEAQLRARVPDLLLPLRTFLRDAGLPGEFVDVICEASAWIEMDFSESARVKCTRTHALLVTACTSPFGLKTHTTVPRMVDPIFSMVMDTRAKLTATAPDVVAALPDLSSPPTRLGERLVPVAATGLDLRDGAGFFCVNALRCLVIDYYAKHSEASQVDLVAFYWDFRRVLNSTGLSLATLGATIADQLSETHGITSAPLAVLPTSSEARNGIQKLIPMLVGELKVWSSERCPIIFDILVASVHPC